MAFFFPRLIRHEDTLLALVADFVGITRGCKLRSALEVAQILLLCFKLDTPPLLRLFERC